MAIVVPVEPPIASNAIGPAERRDGCVERQHPHLRSRLPARAHILAALTGDLIAIGTSQGMRSSNYAKTLD